MFVVAAALSISPGAIPVPVHLSCRISHGKGAEVQHACQHFTKIARFRRFQATGLTSVPLSSRRLQ